MSYTPNQEKLLIGQNGGLVTSGGLVAGNLINMRVLTSGTNATYTPTAGTRLIYVEMCGGGGGGGAATTTTTAQVALGRAGSGSPVIKALINIEGSSTGTYTIGAAGSPATAGGQSTLIINGVTVDSGYGTQGANNIQLTNYAAGIPYSATTGSGQTGFVSGDLTKVLFNEILKNDFNASVASFSNNNFLLYNYGCSGNYFYPTQMSYQLFLGIQQEFFKFSNSGTSISVSSTINGGSVDGRYGMGGASPIIIGTIANLSGQSGNQGVIKIWEYA